MNEIKKIIGKIAMENIVIKTDKEANLNSGKVYKYASLNAIRSTLVPILYKYGLTLIQSINRGDENEIVLVTEIFNNSDIYTSEIVIPISQSNQNEYQAMGSGVTYYSRRVLATLFGLQIEEETDASEITTTKKKILSEGSKEYNTVLDQLRLGATIKDMEKLFSIPMTVKQSLNIDLNA